MGFHINLLCMDSDYCTNLLNIVDASL